jgi:prepilin-type N-terminal cleavage/methylation domain-containing protein
MNNTPHPSDRSAFTLIELLIVIAIIGILMSLLFPAVNGAIDAARKAQAKNDVTQIATAVIAYETEYGKLPYKGTAPTTDATLSADSNEIVGVLMGTDTANNPRGIVFLEVQDVSKKKGKSGIDANGKFVDPWGNIYQIALDYNYDNSNKVTSGNESKSGSAAETLRKKVAVFNIADSVDTKTSASNHFRHVVKSW